jgi:hypothetical protein
MTEEQAIAIATEYLHRRQGPHPNFAGHACSFELKGAYPERSNDWTVLYKIVLLDYPGAVVEGDVMIIVDEVSGEAKFFNELYS